jgi:hypothetical protein
MLSQRSSTDPKLRKPESMLSKISRINTLLDDLLIQFPQQERNFDTELFGVFNCSNELCAYSFTAKVKESKFQRMEHVISDQTHIYTSGSGSSLFINQYNNAKANKAGVSEAAIYFNSFITFLKSGVDNLSSLPPQAVVISRTGDVKPVSIKVNDQFYKLGSTDDERANYKKEIDYRDEEFEFLHANGKIKGRDRKKYRLT